MVTHDRAIFGLTSRTANGWIFEYDFQMDDLLHLYGISDVLTVPGAPVPEPGTMSLAFVAAIVLAAKSRK